MTKHALRELKVCKDDIAEFAKWCTDYDRVIRMLSLWDLAFVTTNHMEFGEIQDFAAIFCLWRAMFHNEATTICAVNSDPSFSVAREIYRKLPEFLKSGCVINNQHRIQFDGGGSIHRSGASAYCMKGMSMHRICFVEFSRLPVNVQTDIHQSVYPIMSSRSDGSTSMYFLEDRDD